MVVKNVHTGWFGSDRKLFHAQCWRVFHARRRKKDAIGVLALLDLAALFFSDYLLPWFYFLDRVKLVFVGMFIFVALVVMYYLIEE